MNWIVITGLIAAFCTTISFLPQAVKIIKTRDTSAISAAMYSLFTFGTLMWLIFGVASRNVPVMLANAVTLLLSSVILCFKLIDVGKEKRKVRIENDNT